METRNPLVDPLSKDNLCTFEAMQLLVEAEKDRRVEAGEEIGFDCTVVDVDNPQLMQDFTDRLLSLQATLGEDPMHLQLIIKDQAHFLTVGFELSQQGNSFLVLDAAGDPRAHKHFLNFSKMENMQHHFIAAPTELDGDVNGIQTDFHSCGAFAFDHAVQLSWLPHLYAELPAKDVGGGMVGWTSMPPELVWNAQSYKWLDNYCKLNKEIVKQDIPVLERTFVEILAKNQGLLHAPVQRTRNAFAAQKTEPPKRINQAAENHFKAYQQQTQYYINERLPTILNQNSNEASPARTRP